MMVLDLKTVGVCGGRTGREIDEIYERGKKNRKKNGKTENKRKRKSRWKTDGEVFVRFDVVGWMVAAARVVYLWHNGKQHIQIEKKMRELGFASFHRNYLYAKRQKNGRRVESWPEKFGWADQVTRARPKRKLKRRKAAAPDIPDTFRNGCEPCFLNGSGLGHIRSIFIRSWRW